MTSEQILQLVGKPSVVKNLKNAEVKAEVWLYRYDKLDGVKQVATSMQDVPYVDPITGILKMIQEPVYSQERTYLVETTELLVVDGKLTSSKRYRTTRRDFN